MLPAVKKQIDRARSLFHYIEMASRSWSSQAIVLNLTPFGENHREASVLTRERGLVKAAVFGGAKSRLRSAVAPYHSGQMWFYSDPVKKTNKITDFDVKQWRENIRENLVRTWCASLCTEIVLRSQGGMSDWILVNGFFDGINISGEDECKKAVLRFLWRTAVISGFRINIETCSRCGTSYGTEHSNSVLWYEPQEDGCLCSACAGKHERIFPLSAEGRFYLQAVETCKPGISRSLDLSAQTYIQLRDFLFFITARMLGGKVKTIESGAGIL